jgi:hypothetical protein
MLLLFAVADMIHNKEAPVNWPTVDVILLSMNTDAHIPLLEGWVEILAEND